MFVVDVSSFTNEGFVGATTYEGKVVDIEFDDVGKGILLTTEMAGRLRVRRGSRVSLILEGDENEVIELTVAGVGKTPRISDPRVYYALGREGGAIVRIRSLSEA